MSIPDIFLNTLLISAFCLGLRMITDDGMLLYFLRKPFEGLSDKADNLESVLGKTDWSVRRIRALLYIAKPVILCITCMASIWGSAVFFTINPITGEMVTPWIIAIVSATFINTIGWAVLNKLR